MNELIYISLMLGSLLFPFAFSFEKRIRFHTKWKYLWVAIAIPAAFFIIWDVWFTAKGVWWFNDPYILGPRLLDLPLEEWLFFVVIPYCSLFIYEIVKYFLPDTYQSKLLRPALIVLVGVFALITFLYVDRAYTFYNFLFNTLFLIFLLLNKWFREHLTHFILAFFIALIPMFLVNGVLTSLPVVGYNPLENSGIRITTIPVEDFFYFFLLFMMNVFIYERLQRRSKS